MSSNSASTGFELYVGAKVFFTLNPDVEQKISKVQAWAGMNMEFDSGIKVGRCKLHPSLKALGFKF